MKRTELIKKLQEGGAVLSRHGASAGRSKLASVRLPAQSKRVSVYLFENCTNLKTVALPAGLKEIGREAFKNCSSLTEVDIPAGITYIDKEAFLNCTSLRTITIRARTPPIARRMESVVDVTTGTMGAQGTWAATYAIDFGSSLHPDYKFYVPAGTEAAYRTALGLSANNAHVTAIPN